MSALSTDQKSTIKRICALLSTDWDPIGVSDEPNSESEYDSYGLRIFGKIQRGCSVAEIAKFLIEIEIDLGLTPNVERAERVAHKLLAL